MLKKAPREGLLTLRNIAAKMYNTPDSALLSSRNLSDLGERKGEKNRERKDLRSLKR
jgi:hypothetical protein